MKAEYVSNEKLGDFIAFCANHRHKVDESFLYDEDLKNFQPDNENPAYVITDQNGNVNAAASLIMDDYHRRGKNGRFRIFYSEIEDPAYYQELLNAIKNHTSELEQAFVFIPLEQETEMKLAEEINFTVERYSYLLVRDDLGVPNVSLPADYEIRPFRPGSDEEVWCKIRNKGFANLKGSETPITAEMVSKMISASSYLEGGMKILYHKEKPVGIVRGAKDEFEDSPIMNIGPLAILPEYQGKGLGRNLLRAALQFAKEKSYDRTILCVNADNEGAKALYLQEGFKQVHGVACYVYNFNGDQ
ncbi:GNAT family N-acetyltransferase [Bacillus sp. S/N-304-OC-R1]|uniref:GNAT family N-acetyltransferase n=1 Tax=Bacillus sp. S/N-304-OC-R1 TaxID=2758034 RepID=UPI001C8F090E|nr:GNAT family N-acetyltransferase [Bacillus sp. S/N-304-OC-R1]MBY0123541.1 GNAT family N-acetyltransferase [Bacillus sp. S/N-304-OC-R1]